ncbi:MAG: glycosyltransferase [Planctomycetes bacterium]|nr:glycosyltransferase [Planctomycetota bacterium]
MRSTTNAVESPTDAIRICHVLGADLDAVVADVRLTLCSRLTGGFSHSSVRVGGSPVRFAPRTIGSAPDADVFCAWSQQAVAWTLKRISAADDGVRAVLPARAAIASRVASTVDPEPLSRIAFAAATAREQQLLAATGIAQESIALIRPGVDFRSLQPERRAAVRADLEIADDVAAILVLPPVMHATGGLNAAWSLLLAQRVASKLSMIVPGNDREIDRMVRMVDSVGRRGLLRLVGSRYELPELLVACDLAIYLPCGESPTECLAWAMASGRPILASATPAVTELLSHELNAWLCRPGSIKNGAKRILEIVERNPADQRRCEQARAQAYAVFSRQRVIEQFARLFSNLRAGRSAADGIIDAALT